MRDSGAWTAPFQSRDPHAPREPVALSPSERSGEWNGCSKLEARDPPRRLGTARKPDNRRNPPCEPKLVNRLVTRVRIPGGGSVCESVLAPFAGWFRPKGPAC